MENKINLGHLIFDDIEFNPYLGKIYTNLLYMYSQKIIYGNYQTIDINLADALRFADLLSKSNHIQKKDFHKQLGLEIIILLNELFPSEEIVKQYLGSILVANGNYPSLKMNLPQYKNTDYIENILDTMSMNEHIIPGTNGEMFSTIQKEVYDHFEDESFSYSGPTSMGKSFLIRHFIKQKISEGSRSNFVFLVPTNALINEISNSLHSELKSLLAENKYRIVTVTESILLQLENNNFIFILTPERLLYLLMNHKDIIINYIFVDEAHKMITADGRSSFYYKVVDFLTKRQIQTPKIIFSSPNIPNPYLFQNLILGTNVQNTYSTVSLSPVNQYKFLLDFHNSTFKVYNSISNTLETIGSINANITFNNLIKKQSNILDEDKTRRNKTLIYCSSINKAITYAKEFADTLPTPTNISEELQKFSDELKEEINEHYFLVELIKKGVAYHVGYLPNKVRVKLEKLFRENYITVLFCTSTLIEGVNFPAKHLFITHYKAGRENLSGIDFKNLIGRVGRIQYNLFGNIFLVNLGETSKLTNKFEELLTTKIDKQELSISTGISKKEKEFIVDLLTKGTTTFEKEQVRKGQKISEYQLMQKTTNILLRDILNDNESLVVNEFKPYLEGKVETIKNAFSSSSNLIDDDINISHDQVVSLREMIEKYGMNYPVYEPNDPDMYNKVVQMLEDFCKTFNWDKLDPALSGKPDTNGEHTKFKYYATMLLQWIRGNGINFITKGSIDYHEDKLEKWKQDPIKNQRTKIKIDGWDLVEYDGSPLHKNIVIADTLDTIENTILFSINNYCIKFSREYKNIFPNDDNFIDWHDFIEYGTTNYKDIFLQKAGLSRETAKYIREKGWLVIESIGEGRANYYLKNDIFTCNNQSVKDECELLKINLPELFED